MSADLRFELPGGARAWFTTRAEGNLSSVGGEGCEDGGQARAALLAQTGAQALARGYQVHGTVVRRVRERPPAPESRPDPGDPADGQAAAASGVALLVLAADCMPVALAAPGAAAVVHAGWRGLAGGVLEEGLAAVRELGGSGPVTAVVGPAAGACCYEVGPEVHAALGTGVRTHAKVDLRAAAERRLRAAGVQDVLHADHCTICDERFFSHRREGARAGRQGGVVWLQTGEEGSPWSS